MWRYILSGLVGALIVILLAWSSVFWKPFGFFATVIEYSPDTYESYDYSPDTFEPYSSFGAFTFGKSAFGKSKITVEELLKRLGLAGQDTLKLIFRDLRHQPTDELFILKSEIDPCADAKLINCRGVKSEVVKPFIEAALALRQQAGTDALATQANYIAGTGVLIALISLVIAFFRKTT